MEWISFTHKLRGAPEVHRGGPKIFQKWEKFKKSKMLFFTLDVIFAVILNEDTGSVSMPKITLYFLGVTTILAPAMET